MMIVNKYKICLGFLLDIVLDIVLDIDVLINELEIDKNEKGCCFVF